MHRRTGASSITGSQKMLDARTHAYKAHVRQRKRNHRLKAKKDQDIARMRTETYLLGLGLGLGLGQIRGILSALNSSYNRFDSCAWPLLRAF